jgi:hypothetical protein
MMTRYWHLMITALSSVALSYAVVSRIYAQHYAGQCCGPAAPSCGNKCCGPYDGCCREADACDQNTPPQGCTKYCGSCTNATYTKWGPGVGYGLCQSALTETCTACTTYWCAEGQYFKTACGSCCPVTVWYGINGACDYIP